MFIVPFILSLSLPSLLLAHHSTAASPTYLFRMCLWITMTSDCHGWHSLLKREYPESTTASPRHLIAMYIVAWTYIILSNVFHTLAQWQLSFQRFGSIQLPSSGNDGSCMLPSSGNDGSCMLPKCWKDSSYLATVCKTFDMS